jgi:hypothetical protein
MTPKMQPVNARCIWVGFHKVIKSVHQPEHGFFPANMINQRFH